MALGRKQVFTDVPLSGRLRIVEGGAVKTEPFATQQSPAARDAGAAAGVAAGRDLALRAVSRRPTSRCRILRGGRASLVGTEGPAGGPAVLVSAAVAEARAALEALARGATTLAQAGVGSLAIALDGPRDPSAPRAVSPGAVPVVVAIPRSA